MPPYTVGVAKSMQLLVKVGHDYTSPFAPGIPDQMRVEATLDVGGVVTHQLRYSCTVRRDIFYQHTRVAVESAVFGAVSGMIDDLTRLVQDQWLEAIVDGHVHP